MKKYVLFLLISSWIFPISTLASKLPAIPKYEIVEIAFEVTNQYENPFVELDAEAELYRPDGSVWSIPLFWDGGQTWKLRISPDIEGEWSYKISSTDNGLKGKSGKFNCTKSTGRGSVRPMKDYPYHFQYQNGEKMWFMGDTQWALFTDNSKEKHNRSSVEHYLKTRASQGFNAVHAMLLSEAGWGNSGGMPFIDMRQQILNPDYWKEVDARVAFANKQGMIVDSGGQLVFFLQRQGEKEDAICEKFIIMDKMSEIRGEWLDFVMQVKWTGNADGFLKFWVKKENGANYSQKIDYKGRTFWNDEDKGPYFKMGLYMGDPGWKGPAERTVYTDEYRLGNAECDFHDVDPSAKR